MKRALAPIAILGLALTGCGGSTEATGPPEDGYKKFSEVDPYVSDFFMSLEDEDSDPITYDGGHPADSVYVQMLWTYGVGFCEDLDKGKSPEKAFANLEKSISTSALPEVVAPAAVDNICEHHSEAFYKAVENAKS